LRKTLYFQSFITRKLLVPRHFRWGKIVFKLARESAFFFWTEDTWDTLYTWGQTNLRLFFFKSCKFCPKHFLSIGLSFRDIRTVEHAFYIWKAYDDNLFLEVTSENSVILSEMLDKNSSKTRKFSRNFLYLSIDWV